MPIQLSLDGLQKLKEDRLRKEVLIPLFRAMGFRDVTELHGTLELGKDIVMWQQDLLRGRVNFAVVVKSIRISAGHVSADICRQVREALGSTFTDPVSLEERRAHRVIVVTSKDVTTSARKSIQSELNALIMEGRVDLLDGEQLIERIRQHLPRTLLWDPLSEMGRALRESDPSFDYVFQASSEGSATVFLSPAKRESSASTLRGSFRVRADDDALVQHAQAELRRFLDTGRAVELTEDVLGEVKLPPIVDSLLGGGKVKSIRMSPARLHERLLVVLEFIKDGVSLHQLSYLEFTHSRGGIREGALENLDQEISIHAELVLDKETRRQELKLNFLWSKANAFQTFKWLLLRRAYYQSSHVRLLDFNSGALLGVIEAGTGENPDDASIEIYRRLAVIQTATGTMIPAPEQGRISADQIRAILRVSQIIEAGFLEHRSGRVAFTPEEESMEKFREKIGEAVRIQLSEAATVETVLEQEIELGPQVLLVQGTLRETEPGSANMFFVEATTGLPFIEVFPQWAGTSDLEKSVSGQEGMRDPTSE
jgi:hypothetical protein